MVGSIFSSDSWNNVTFIAGEMSNPKRNIGLSLFFRYADSYHYLCIGKRDVYGVFIAACILQLLDRTALPWRHRT